MIHSKLEVNSYKIDKRNFLKCHEFHEVVINKGKGQGTNGLQRPKKQ